MDKTQEKLYGTRRLENERHAAALKKQRADRNPERFKRILPPSQQRGRRG
jgi:hypothetical protein